MKYKTRGFTSLLLSLAFLVLSVSGVVLYASPKGRVAYWTNWTLFGLGKESWEAVHVNISILLLLASAFHLYFNWNIFLRYLKKKARWAVNLKKEFAAALLITAFVIFGSLADAPPFSTVMHLKSRIQTAWEQSAPTAPAPHAEEFSINRLAQTIGTPVEDVLKTLRQEGFDVENRFVSVRQVGEKHGIAPSDVYAAIAKHHRTPKKAGCSGRKGACPRGDGQDKPK